MPLEGGLAELMDVLARLLHSEMDETAVLDCLACTAVGLIPGAQEASIGLVVNRQKIEARAFSGDLAQRMDALQEQVGQGPCLDSVYERKTIMIPDMASESRWPRFSLEARALGASSMLCFQLFTDGNNAGTFNLYSRQVNAFDGESVRAGMLVAAHATVVFMGTQKLDRCVRRWPHGTSSVRPKASSWSVTSSRLQRPLPFWHKPVPVATSNSSMLRDT